MTRWEVWNLQPEPAAEDGTLHQGTNVKVGATPLEANAPPLIGKSRLSSTSEKKKKKAQQRPAIPLFSASDLQTPKSTTCLERIKRALSLLYLQLCLQTHSTYRCIIRTYPETNNSIMRILNNPLIPEQMDSAERSPSPEFSPLAIGEDLTPLPAYKAAQTNSFDIAGLLSTPLKLHEDLASGCGGQTWPAGMVLAKHMLRHHREALTGARMLVTRPHCARHVS